ncbi:hypothetical protein SARC_09768 [Sphaeroforma arctica JP610]|uniref:Ubiquitin-like domain-containing protein n=1 Tax=Sphaeroforma arctica JP610 TaxID=667725 RepID=A0A0L0FLX7_9EUKA|nr:hypothetical protein SARC_09768 [Sphaeroforma arctica JP610]KNC77782.1 hypothetical protein SARC_09768 [Sphaeroforma arctica JP610]|eukprot:XP_014151684.1 hypothetical protein SARC_09768 [Sphaeroforma arctica JP610]
MPNNNSASIPGTFQIKVLSMTGQKFRINVCASDPVLAVLTTLGNYLRVPPQHLQLVLKHTTYTALTSHHRTIVAYGVRPGVTLHLQPTVIKSGPISFSPPAMSYELERTHRTEHNTGKAHDTMAPKVTWSDTPAATPALVISQERQIENQQLKQRMTEIRSKMERRKGLRSASVGTN